MKLLFIVNPISGGVDKEPFLKEAEAICKNYGIKYDIFKTTGVNDHEEALKVLHDSKPDKVISVGGDGTTLFTSILLLDTDYPMGIIPLGSANGMATELYVKPSPIEAFKDIIMSDIVKGLDILLIRTRLAKEIIRGVEDAVITRCCAFKNTVAQRIPPHIIANTAGGQNNLIRRRERSSW